MKILALLTKLNEISYKYSVDPQGARNAKTKLSLVQGPRFSFFDPPPPFGGLFSNFFFKQKCQKLNPLQFCS